MSEAPKVIWAAGDEITPEWEGFWHVDASIHGGTKYHHDDTVTTLQAKVGRLEAALERVRRISQKGGMPTGLRMQTMDTVARTALRAIALDTTTSTCDNTREGE